MLFTYNQRPSHAEKSNKQHEAYAMMTIST